ncbi:hypothetical protein K505DRAFT_20547 [Melanomma pulvis-pyrius CBS 109.77]|uniref:Uncharacterized protein n=1 Tax=Melanomma pulvis-pyrius CBS 109.77 TaxID=1314802 RepID=A0A6A6XF62_9PLEO|nr:hypothetical protein K505DRAFT_20547 [Melanomma pulvis-pyrius CBS 109.77]
MTTQECGGACKQKKQIDDDDDVRRLAGRGWELLYMCAVTARQASICEVGAQVAPDLGEHTEAHWTRTACTSAHRHPCAPQNLLNNDSVRGRAPLDGARGSTLGHRAQPWAAQMKPPGAFERLKTDEFASRMAKSSFGARAPQRFETASAANPRAVPGQERDRGGGETEAGGARRSPLLAVLAEERM